ncbi:MAG: helix-turn-helix transcriptional regulator [Lachnospiraceae bacterium]|nr:helix-turn-helix transcriptional regulator [Lachnospiraceae bacterium]
MKRKIPTINMVKTGQNILHLREQAGLSVKELQEIFGFATPQAIYKWQRGTAMPTVDNLVVLAAVFNVPLDNILVVEETMQVQILSA